jgi:two-component system, LytTR family, sensor kinase
LQQDGFTITQDECSFMVTLPLLPPQLADDRSLGLTNMKGNEA